ncbi:MAG: Crp/Fnr family transcriptional regulator [Cycloclasticus sp.]|nr:Crp/Fnr family transcriptional regulator [Cycloclasticus sp.]
METTALHHLLKQFGCLDSEDFILMESLLEKKNHVDIGDPLLIEGAPFNKVTLITEGWAQRYKSLPDGRKQILNFLLPGDFYGLFSPLFEESEYGVEALTRVELRSFSSDKMFEAFKTSPRLGIALTWLAGMDERQLDEQIVRIGIRNASERMAHMFLELHMRQMQAGIPDIDARHLPLTQSTLADALGMSHVHANRSFKFLVNKKLVTFKNHEIYLKDIKALVSLVDFDASYLETTEVSSKTLRSISS